jgi:GH25 family lysozyme M1 (1,4-beta-N-acetylmuramidase)
MFVRIVIHLPFSIIPSCALSASAHSDGSTFFDNPHPLTTSANIDAKWARINADLKARNYRVNASNGGTYGVDLSQWAGQDTFSCLVQNGMSFAIVRAFCSDCTVDPNGVHTVANAVSRQHAPYGREYWTRCVLILIFSLSFFVRPRQWAAGVSHVDIYLFPSFDCSISAAGQVDAAIDNMGSIPFGTLWFDIEAEGSDWSSDTDQNNAWLQEGVNQAVARLGGSRVGIYSSAYGWSVAMGEWGNVYSFPIWYQTTTSHTMACRGTFPDPS